MLADISSFLYPLILYLLTAGEESASSAITTLCSTIPNPDTKQVGIKLGKLFETFCSCVLLTQLDDKLKQ